MVKSIALLLLTASPTLLAAQGSYQILLDIAPPGSPVLLDVLPSSDGAVIAVFDDGADSYVFRRFNAEGEHEWSKRVQSPAFRDLWSPNMLPSLDWYGGWRLFFPDHNGGLFYVGPTWQEEDDPGSYGDGIGLDTAVNRTAILHMDGGGTGATVRILRNEWIAPADTIRLFHGAHHVNAALFPDGGLFLLAEHFAYWTGWTNRAQGTRLLPNGDVAWSHWYHLPGEPVTMAAARSFNQQLLADTAGGIFVIEEDLNRLGHLDSEGHCEWVRNYLYDGQSLGVSSGSAVDPETNELVSMNTLATWAGWKQTMMRVAVNGELAGVSVFDLPDGPPGGRSGNAF